MEIFLCAWIFDPDENGEQIIVAEEPEGEYISLYNVLKLPNGNNGHKKTVMAILRS